MSHISEKIAKLLALAESPVEAEAKAALLKARELMAEHKLRPEDIGPAQNERVIKEHVGIQTTKLTTPWAVLLSDTVARHYCCKAYRTHWKGRKMDEIGFIGLEDDFKVCAMVFRYAYDCIMARCREIKEDCRRHYQYPAAQTRQLCNAYGWGFTNGLLSAFKAQTEKHQEWGLVLVVPKAVKEAASTLKDVSYAEPVITAQSKEMARMGYEDGQRFNPARRLGASEKQKLA